MKIIADKNIPFLEGVVEKYGQVEYLAGSDFSNEKLKDADVLIVRTVAHLDKEMLEGTSVKLICSATIGFDHIDTHYCDMHGIKWTNAPGCNSGSVEQYIISSLLVIAQRKDFELKDKTIGIVGVGNVGKKVAKACQALGMKVLLNDPLREDSEGSQSFVSLVRIKSEADIITFHAPLTKEGQYKTLHLADAAFFASLGKRPIIINSARGGIIETQAIKDAIATNKISGAVIDCWEGEPYIDLDYLEMIDIATPHIAGYSADGKSNATRMSLEVLADFYRLDKGILRTIQPSIPVNHVIDLNEFDNSIRLESAILSIYNPLADYERLQSSPRSFKQLRNEYPFRRESIAYKIINANVEEASLLSLLGFNV